MRARFFWALWGSTEVENASALRRRSVVSPRGAEIWGQGSNLRPVGPEPTALPLSYPRFGFTLLLAGDGPTDGEMSGGRARTCVQSVKSRPLYH
jgi:hypothetical protein